MHQGGNDVNESRPYAGMTAADRKVITDGMDALLAVAHGDTRFYPMSVSFRPYGNPFTATTVFQDPSLGSKPFNDNLFIPWIAANWPHAMASYGRPKLDLYRRVLLNYESIVGGDGLHLRSEGIGVIRAWDLARVDDLISGTTIPENTERVYVPPVVNPDPAVIVKFGNVSVGANANFLTADQDALATGSVTKAISGTAWSVNVAVDPPSSPSSLTSPGRQINNAGRVIDPPTTYDNTLRNRPVTLTNWLSSATPNTSSR